MALKYFCDRCNKEILPVKTMYLRHEETQHKIILFKDMMRINRVTWSLCEACGNKFIEWFKHPERDGEVQYEPD